MILDLDSDRSYRAFVRYCSDHVGPELMAVGKTPRGWHVWLWMQSDGWSQGSVGAWMRSWLGSDAHGIEHRCGDKSYVVWPEGAGRYWVDVGVFGARVAGDWQPLGMGGVAGSWGPPWRVTESQVLRLDLACARLAKTPLGNTNNVLNQVAFYQGAAVVWACGEEAQPEVEQRLLQAYWPENYGGGGGKATVASGLRSGLKRLQHAATGAVS